MKQSQKKPELTAEEIDNRLRAAFDIAGPLLSDLDKLSADMEGHSNLAAANAVQAAQYGMFAVCSSLTSAGLFNDTDIPEDAEGQEG